MPKHRIADSARKFLDLTIFLFAPSDTPNQEKNCAGVPLSPRQVRAFHTFSTSYVSKYIIPARNSHFRQVAGGSRRSSAPKVKNRLDIDGRLSAYPSAPPGGAEAIAFTAIAFENNGNDDDAPTIFIDLIYSKYTRRKAASIMLNPLPTLIAVR